MSEVEEEFLEEYCEDSSEEDSSSSDDELEITEIPDHKNILFFREQKKKAQKEKGWNVFIFLCVLN